jgi:hypothetical protein
MLNKCWECKNNILKIKVLVPHNRTIKEYVHRTGNFQSDIVAVVKEKPGQYTVWFRSGGDIKLMTFNLLHNCRLNKAQKPDSCPCYMHSEEALAISNITYSKQPTPEELTVEH